MFIVVTLLAARMSNAHVESINDVNAASMNRNATRVSEAANDSYAAQRQRIFQKLKREPVILMWRQVEFKIGLLRKVGPWRIQRKAPSRPPGRSVDASTSLLANAEQRPILRGVSGVARPGEMVAIMGSSGAGKTTLLNILAGRVNMRKGDELTGQVLVNGERRNPMWRRTAGYVEQEDLLYGDLTVQETIQFAADMKLPKTLTEGEKRFIVDRVVDLLGLKTVQYNRIGSEIKRGISGGEKKRVAIGVELVTFPSVLFLDEPTTGLDAAMALTLIETLKNIAEKTAMTIVLTIHQPRASILPIFTRIMFLAKGRLVYNGPIDACLEHLQQKFGLIVPYKENPADYIMDLLTVKAGDHAAAELLTQMHQGWSEIEDTISDLNHNLGRPDAADEEGMTVIPVGPAASRNVLLTWPNNRGAEFYLLLSRNFVLWQRDWLSIVATLGQTIFTCLLLSFTFFQLDTSFGGVQGRLGILFFLCISTCFTTITPLLQIFAVDRAILLRERSGATYRVLPGYSAKFISLLPFSLLQIIISSIPLYFIVGLTMPFDRLLVFLTILLALRFTSIGMGLFIAAISPTLQVSMIFGPLILVVFLLYGGNLANSNEITWILRWMQYISLIFYSYQALAQNEFDGNYYGVQNDNVELVPGSFYLDLYGLDQVGIWGCFGCLLGLGAAFLLAGYVGLRATTRPRIKYI